MKRSGYGRRHVDGKVVSVHRWVVAQIDGWDALEGQSVLHLCDNPPCYRYDHLRIGSHAENMADCAAKGRFARGERVGRAVLTSSDVDEIRSSHASGESQQSLAARFGVTNPHISRIVRGLTWQHTHQPVADASHQRHGNAKLTRDQVIDIRARYAAGQPKRSIARDLGINRATVVNVINGRTWRHVATDESSTSRQGWKS